MGNDFFFRESQIGLLCTSLSTTKCRKVGQKEYKHALILGQVYNSDQAQETAQHLLISCVFTWQCWVSIFQNLNLNIDVPANTTIRFSTWWCNTIKSVPKDLRKGLNLLIILVSWEIWKHRNSCVFRGSTAKHPGTSSDRGQWVHPIVHGKGH